MRSSIASGVIMFALGLLLPIQAGAAQPALLGSAAGTCVASSSNDYRSPWSIANVPARQDFLLRYQTTGSASSVFRGDGLGERLYTGGAGVDWANWSSHSGGPMSGKVQCPSGNVGYSIEVYDIPVPPVTFSGTIAPGGYLFLQEGVSFLAPGQAPYVADVSVSSGTFVIGQGLPSDGTPFASSGQYPFGSVEKGTRSITFGADDGPPASWTMTIRALPVTLSDLSWSKETIEPGDVSRLSYQSDGDTSLTALVTNERGDVVRTLAQALGITTGSRSLTWDGRADSGRDVPDGKYTLTLQTADPSGLTGSTAAPLVVNTPPDTRFTKKPSKSVSTGRKATKRVKFAFTSDEPDATFECNFKRGWSPCTSPQRFRLKPGKYVFPVRAKDRFGAVDPSPESWKFRVRG